MSFPYHAVLLMVYIVTFPFDLHSAAVFDSHIPCRSPAMPRIYPSRQPDGMRTAWELNVGDLPAVRVFLLPRGVPGSLLSEAGEWQGRGMVRVNRALTFKSRMTYIY